MNRGYFRPANQPSVLSFQADGQHWRLGLTICEDLWVEDALQAQRLVGTGSNRQPHP